jgi:hypothetical protein
MQERQRILLLRPDKAGDAIKTLPVLRAVSSKAGEYELSLLSSENNFSLFEFEPGIRVYCLPKNWKKMKRGTLLHSIFGSETVDSFSKCVSLLCDKSVEVDQLLELLPAQRKFAAWPIPFGEELKLPENSPAGRDETQNIGLLIDQVFHCDLANHLKDFSSVPSFTESDLSEANEKMGPKEGRWLGFCPFAGNQNRSHPIKKWARFVSKVTSEKDYDKFFLFGAPSDYRRLEELKESSKMKDATELCFPSSFRTLGAYLKRLDGVVAVDSGPLHLAHSLEVRSLGILSGGDVERWYPVLNQGDFLLRRGLINRFPSVLEMMWAFEKWKARAS